MDIVKLNKKRTFLKVLFINIILFCIFVGLSYMVYYLSMSEPINFIKLEQRTVADKVNRLISRYIKRKEVLSKRISYLESQTNFKIYIFDIHGIFFNKHLPEDLLLEIFDKEGEVVYNDALYYSTSLDVGTGRNAHNVYTVLEFPKETMSELEGEKFKKIFYKGFAIYLIIAFIVSLTTIIISMINIDKFQTKIFGSLIRETDDGVIITDGKGNIIYSNQSFIDMFGVPLGKLLGQNISKFDSAMHDKEFFKVMMGRLNREGNWEGEVVNTKSDGTKVFSELRMTKIINKDSNEKFFIGMYRDKTSYKNEIIDMLRLQFYDNFTGLPNRTYTRKYLEKLIGSKVDFAALIVSFENFREINQNFGTDIGDKVLIQLVERLKGLINYSTFIARIDGRKIGIILEDFELSNLIDFIVRISELSERKFTVYNDEVSLVLNIGKAIYPEDADSIRGVLNTQCIPVKDIKTPDIMQKIKDSVSSRQKKIQHTTSLLEKAVENKEFSIKFQPRIDSESNKLVGGEALIRWNNSELGSVSPMYFIPLAEKSGLIGKIAEWTFSELCSQLSQWKKSKIELVPISLNISPAELVEGKFKQLVIEVFNKNELKTSDLQLELTEGALGRRFKKVQTHINELFDRGFNVIIDNFGTGNSKLEYLKNLNISYLKIDREFIRNYPEKDDGNTVKMIIQTAKSLGLQVIGEGTETAEQVNFLRSNGCHLVQGYYYSKPVTAGEFEEFLKSGKITPA